MKKKFLFSFLAIMFVLPVMLLTACGEVNKYSFLAKTSSSDLGYISGGGQIDEGQEVKLIATAYKNKDSYFAGWVYQNNMLITDASPYKIENTADENGKVTKSVLTFSSANERQGQYTAVFAGGNMQYVKLDSFYLTTDLDRTPKAESTLGEQALTNATVEISQETGLNNPQTVYSTTASGTDIALFDNVLVPAENITSILYLEYENPMYVSVNMHFALNGEIQVFDNVTANLSYGKSTAKTEDTQKGLTSEVAFDGTTYKIIFGFSVANTDYFMVINYSALS